MLKKIMFIDTDLPFVLQQYADSNRFLEFELVCQEPFVSLAQTLHNVMRYTPDVIVIAFDLKGEVSGAVILDFLRRQGGYTGHAIDNSGADGRLFSSAGVWVDEVAFRTPDGLRTALDDLDFASPDALKRTA